MLCNRCELLFGECRPLLGAVCAKAPERCNDERAAPLRPAGALVITCTAKTVEANIRPIAVADISDQP